MSHYRKHQPSAIEALAREPAAARPDDAADSAENVAVVQHALSRMPSPQARLLETFHFDEYSTAEIATAAGLSERAVEGRLRRARQRLRRELESLLGIKGED